MAQKIISAFGLIVLLAVAVFFGRSLIHKSTSRQSQGPYRFVKLPSPLMARAGDVTLNQDAVLDLHYISLTERQAEMRLALSYEQFAAQIQKATSVSWRMKKPLKKIKDLCVMFGVICADSPIHRYDLSQKDFLVIDGRGIDDGQLKTENLAWQALQTEILNHIIANVERGLRRQGLLTLAAAAQMSTQDFARERILANHDLPALAQERLQKDFPSGGERHLAKMYETQIQDEIIDAFLREHYVKLPIEINVRRPEVKLDLRWDWVPHLGDSKSPLRVIFVSDYFSESGQQIFAQIKDFQKRWPHVVFGHRPFFPKGDTYQVMLSEMSFCVWNSYSPRYWDFLQKASFLKQPNFEQDLFAILEELKIDTPDMKSCFLQRRYKNAVEYHQKWLAHYRILAAPVSFIGDEVYMGAVQVPILDKIISRQ